METTASAEARLLAAVLAGLLVVAPTPGRAWQVLAALPAGGGSPSDPAGPVLAVVALAAWGLAGSLVGCTALLLLARLPGLAGRRAGRVAAHAVPAAVQRGLGVLLGAGLVLGTAGALPASAQTGATSAPTGSTSARAVTAAGPTTDLDWPTTPAAGDPETAKTAPAASSAAARAHGGAGGVVVAPGDTLWGLAERSLRSQAGVPSAAAVAAEWPSWWAANRDVLGENPHLLHPGTRLAAPPA